MDSLVEVPFTEWLEIRDNFRMNWPASLPYYYAVHLNINYPAVRDALQFKLYSAYGDFQNGMLATNIKDSMEFVIMPVCENTDKLVDAIAETKLIDWNRRTCVNVLTPASVKCLQKLQQILGLTECNINFANTFLYSSTLKPFETRPLPENTYLGQVKIEHIPLVDDAWPYKHGGSHFYFLTLASNGLSYALYSTKDNSLVSWVFINEYSFICHLYTVDSHRKLGCAKYLMEYLINDQLRKGSDAYGFVVHGNVKSARLFEILGFKRIEDNAWAYIKKY